MVTWHEVRVERRCFRPSALEWLTQRSWHTMVKICTQTTAWGHPDAGEPLHRLATGLLGWLPLMRALQTAHWGLCSLSMSLRSKERLDWVLLIQVSFQRDHEPTTCGHRLILNVKRTIQEKLRSSYKFLLIWAHRFSAHPSGSSCPLEMHPGIPGKLPWSWTTCSWGDPILIITRLGISSVMEHRLSIHETLYSIPSTKQIKQRLRSFIFNKGSNM